MYRALFDLVLSRLDPERAHHLAFVVIRALPAVGLGGLARRFTAPDPSLAVDALGLRFASVYQAFDSLDDFESAIRSLRLAHHPEPVEAK